MQLMYGSKTEIITEILRTIALLGLVSVFFGGILAIIKHFEEETGMGDDSDDDNKQNNE